MVEVTMEQYIYDKRNGLHYELVGDYYYPCLTVPAEPRIGIWGMRRLKYLQGHKKINILSSHCYKAMHVFSFKYS